MVHCHLEQHPQAREMRQLVVLKGRAIHASPTTMIVEGERWPKNNFARKKGQTSEDNVPRLRRRKGKKP